MSVWLCIPSARPIEQADEIFGLWRDRGYSIAIQRDPGTATSGKVQVTFKRPYQGYAEAVNYISGQVLMMEPDAQWIVCAGDDTEPDMNHTAEEIAAQCSEHFAGTFGVMQCVGDRWGEHRNTHTFTPRAGQGPQMCSQCGRVEENSIHMQGALIDRVAGSPWLGREWCLRANQGCGPLYPGFKHMFVDQCLRDVAVQLGVYWERRDLIHLHKHYGRVPNAQIPEHLKQWNTREHWDESEALYKRLKADGFKECLPSGA